MAKYSNSKLVSYTNISPNKNTDRNKAISRITPHCIVGQWSAKKGCDYFANQSVKASANYVIGKDGDIGLCVEEKSRAWTSSSAANDNRAITVEIASDTKHPYTMTDKAIESFINLCIDICKRNNKNKLIWFNNKDKALNYQPKNNEMIITLHKYFKNKACPGDYIISRLDEITNKVNEGLSSPSQSTSTPFKVKIKADSLNIRKGPSTSYPIAAKPITDGGVYTILEVKNEHWGRLKSGLGWISIHEKYVDRL